MPSHLHRILWVGLALTPVIFISCAQVTVRKVPTPTQYTRWTDKMQEKADNMEGFRFYLPRPFVQVRQSFPIRTENYLVQGKVSADGKYVVVGSVDVDSGLAKYVAHGANQALIPMRKIRYVPGGSENGPDEQAENANEKNNRERNRRELTSEVVDTGTDGKKARESSSTGAARPKATTVEPGNGLTGLADLTGLSGIDRRGVTNDNGAVAVQPLRGSNFDIVYMPDFEEQYCVSSQAALGNAEFELNLGQGWSLQGFNSLTDNRELNNRIFDLIDRGIELADTAATAKVDRFIKDLNPGDTAIGEQAENFGDADTSVRAPSQDVTLKVTVVYYAAKGMYPVMKPREITERVTAQQISYHAIDLFKMDPHVTGISEFDPSALARAQVTVANESTDYTVPKYPYQFISFNTFSYMAIEVVHNTEQTGSPFKYRYPDRGTDTEGAEPDPKSLKFERPITRVDPFADGEDRNRSDGDPNDPETQLKDLITKKFDKAKDETPKVIGDDWSVADVEIQQQPLSLQVTINIGNDKDNDLENAKDKISRIAQDAFLGVYREENAAPKVDVLKSL